MTPNTAIALQLIGYGLFLLCATWHVAGTSGDYEDERQAALGFGEVQS